MSVTLGFIALISAVVILFSAKDHFSEEMDYHRGWSDHEDLMRLYDMTPDDEALLNELKSAVKLYIKQTGLYKRGDVQSIDSATDFKEFKDEAWRVTVLRKEQR